MSHDIYDILQRLDEGLNPQQRSVPQLPALFKPKSISVLGTGKDPEHPMHGYAVGANESAEEPTTEAEVIPIRPSGVKFINRKDYLDKRDVIFRILSQPGLDPETKEELKTRLSDFEQAAKAQGLITESDEVNPMRRAVMHRIVNQHPEWITRYGAEALVQAIDDVTEGEDDWEEIGSSDVSAYVNYVKDALADRMGGREEMDDRKPFAEAAETATEDVLSDVKKKLGDYLQDVATAIKKDPELLDKVNQAIDQIGPAVKTIQTDDGHEIKIHGNEDDGFRISIKNRPGQSKFKTLDEATMACEMYCAHRRNRAMSADYIEEKHIS